MPSLRSGRCSPSAFRSLNPVDPSVSLSNYHIEQQEKYAKVRVYRIIHEFTSMVESKEGRVDLTHTVTIQSSLEWCFTISDMIVSGPLSGIKNLSLIHTQS